MAKLTVAAAVALFSTITATQVFAQVFSDPDAFQAQHPDRDVLNGGALTPAARAAAGLRYGVGAVLTLCLRAVFIRRFGGIGNLSVSKNRTKLAAIGDN
jgi:hypothetical protein